MQPVRKAVFPVAGLGTRFLPATKAMPKEMLPVVDKPLIQYAVEEAAAAGITDMIFITGRYKRAIEDHFGLSPELEADLTAKNKTALLDVLHSVTPPGVNFVFIRQHMLAVQDVPHAETNKYGIVGVAEAGAVTSRVTVMVEKPAPEDAPSDLAVIGRYVLEPDVFDRLRYGQRGVGGEIQLTDAIASNLAAGTTYAHRFEGQRFDCGSKQGFLSATVHYARLAGYQI